MAGGEAGYLVRRGIGAALLWACAATAQAEPVALMVGGMEKQIYLPVVLADRLGYFRDAGVEVRLESEPAGVEAADEMLAGAVQGVIGFYDHTIELQSLGKYTESVVQLALVPGEVAVVSVRHPEIRSMADLKGHQLGVTGLGSSTDFLGKFLLLQAGLKLSDVTPVPVGAGDTLIAALDQDHIQAAVTTEPTVSRLLASGRARILVDLRDPDSTRTVLGGPYPAACLYMESTWVAAHPDTVQRLVTALVRALRYIATHDADDITDKMPADFFVGDRALYVSALAVGKGMFTPDGRMPEGGPETVLAVLSQFMPNVGPDTIDLARSYRTDFVAAVP